MIYRKTFEIESVKRFTDVTQMIKDIVHDSGIICGTCNIFSCHTTCGIKIMENELLSLSDIMTYLDKQIPEDAVYQHDRIDLRDVPVDERINAASHIRMLYFPTSETIPISHYNLDLGEWQSIFLVEMDYGIPFRKRKIIVTIGGII